MPGQLFTYFIIFFLYIYSNVMYFICIKKSSVEICLFSYTLTFVMCVFLYHSCSCHYGLFHSGVLSFIFLDTGIPYLDMYSFGFILIFPLLTGKWFCGYYWVSPATSSSSFDFGCDCDGYFPALCLKHQQYCSIFLPQGFPQSQGS